MHLSIWTLQREVDIFNVSVFIHIPVEIMNISLLLKRMHMLKGKGITSSEIIFILMDWADGCHPLLERTGVIKFWGAMIHYIFLIWVYQTLLKFRILYFVIRFFMWSSSISWVCVYYCLLYHSLFPLFNTLKASPQKSYISCTSCFFTFFSSHHLYFSFDSCWFIQCIPLS